MDKPIILPAVSGVGNADKIRVVIYAGNGLAHMPLSEILALAAAAGRQPDKPQSGADAPPA